MIPYEQRVEIIESLRSVNQVVPVHDLDKVKAYFQYHFNVMIAGDDHKNEPIYIEAVEKLKDLGVDTIYVPHKYNISSTIICKKIKGRVL